MAQHENSLPFYRRFLIYQKERFPLLGHGVMITCFTFSAVSYSRICRHEPGFIALGDFFIGIFATITLFLLVRIFDEFKDKDDDKRYRSYLPVPRGLISLQELKIVGGIVAAAQIIVIAVLQPQMLILYSVVLLYLLLMGVEFFIPHWLRRHQIAYITSHMMIIPLIDVYSSGLDWLLGGASLHTGVLWFFAVSYCNGIVLEFGRKIRTPETEEEGVISYTGLYGTRGGVYIWIGLLTATMALTVGAAHYAGYGLPALIVLLVCYALCLFPGVSFLYAPTPKKSKLIEYASIGWTILMYLALGGIPMITSLFS